MSTRTACRQRLGQNDDQAAADEPWRQAKQVNWNMFLRDGSNKTELLELLSNKVCRAETIRNLVIAITGNLGITSSKSKSLDAISSCGLFLLTRDAPLNGNLFLVIKANNTGVLVIATPILAALQTLGLLKMLVFSDKDPPLNGYMFMK